MFSKKLTDMICGGGGRRGEGGEGGGKGGRGKGEGEDGGRGDWGEGGGGEARSDNISKTLYQLEYPLGIW